MQVKFEGESTKVVRNIFYMNNQPPNQQDIKNAV